MAKRAALLFIITLFLVSGCGRAEELKEYQEYIKNAQTAFEKNDFADTVKWYDKAKDIDSLSVDDGRNYLKSKAIIESQEHFKNGTAAAAEGNLKSAIEYLGQVIETDPNYTEARSALADAKGKYAEQLFNDAKESYAKGDYKGAYELMHLSSTMADYKPALDLLPQYEKKYNTVIEAETKTEPKSQGQTGSYKAPYLYSSAESVPVATSEAALNAATDAAISNDMDTFNNLIISGNLLVVPNGTAIEIMDSGMARVKIRISEGKYKNTVGWVQREFVEVN